MSSTTSQRPAATSGSVSSVMISVMVVSRRPTERGVNAFDTSRRSRVWSSPLMLSRVVLARCHSGPDVMPCASSPSPSGTHIRGSRSALRTSS